MPNSGLRRKPLLPACLACLSPCCPSPYVGWPYPPRPFAFPAIPLTIRPVQGTTQAPPRLTERDLIAKMEEHGIGTDATVADHIQKQVAGWGGEVGGGGGGRGVGGKCCVDGVKGARSRLVEGCVAAVRGVLVCRY